ncbi:transcriptional regulator, partial [Mammaliicoccus fleurettii]|nr:transcriptional regulator [Mammaliicoccus fleurettii]
QFIEELKSHGLFSSQPIGIISNMKDILNGEYNNYSYLYVKIPNSKNHYTNTITLKGQYLIGYHLGLDKNIEVTYSKMIQK